MGELEERLCARNAVMLRPIARNLGTKHWPLVMMDRLRTKVVVVSGSKTGCYIFFHHSNLEMGSCPSLGNARAGFSRRDDQELDGRLLSGVVSVDERALIK